LSDSFQTPKPRPRNRKTGQDDAFKVNGEEVHNLTLLGKVIKENLSATTQEYVIDDGTGQVNVKRWVDADETSETAGQEAPRLGQYVRVYGHIRVFQGQRSVIAFNLRPVTDFNEITYHFLEVVYCNAHNGARAAAAPAAAAGVGAAAAAHTAYATPGAAAPAAGGSCSDQVFSIFNGPQGADPNGVNIADVVTALNGRFTDAQVREAVESLVNDGHLYSTVDDAHFRSTLL
jgi:replication factor A2